MIDKFILNENHDVIPAPGGTYKERVLAWAEWMEADFERTFVADETLDNGIRVSTKFLGSDMNLLPDKYPLVFETAVFNGTTPDGCIKLVEIFERYCFWEAAADGHKAAVDKYQDCTEVESWTGFYAESTDTAHRS